MNLDWFFERRQGTRALHAILIGCGYCVQVEPKLHVPNPCITYVKSRWPTVDLWAEGQHWIFDSAGDCVLFTDGLAMLAGIEKTRSA